jgi:hypothetical protein
MSTVEMGEATRYVPVLAENVQLMPFDSSSVEKRFLLVRGDGRRWHVSEYLARVIEAIDGKQDVTAIAAVVAESLKRPVGTSDIDSVLNGFLTTNAILERPVTREWQGFSMEPGAPSPGRPSSMLFRQKLMWGWPLAAVTRVMAVLFRPPVAWVIAGALIAFQLGWCATHIDTITNAMHSSWTDDVVMVLALAFSSMFLHEFGHASACRAFGAKEGEIGFAIYLVFPVFYCDVTDAWKLSRWQRAALDLAGMYGQCLFSTVMLGIYIGTHRDLYLWTFLAITASYIPNLNPFLKMDGYWFLSDMLGVANLSQRVGEMLRGDRSTMQSMSRTMATITYLYLVASIAYMAGFFYWLGKYAVALVRGGYTENIRNVQYASYGGVTDMLPPILAMVASTLVLIFLPFLLWRTLRGCWSWIQDIFGIVRKQRTA